MKRTTRGNAGVEFDRRSFLRRASGLTVPAAAGLLSRTSAARGDDDSKAKPIVFQFQWYPQAQFAGYLMALDQGYYREAGVPDVRLEWSTGQGESLQRLLRGETDFCTGWLSSGLAAFASGADLVHLAQIMQRSALLLVARSHSGIETPADMSGRRVGLWPNEFALPPTAFFRKFDVRPRIVQLNYSILPFLRGAVDVATVMYYNEYHKLREYGLRLDLLKTFHFADYGMNFPEDAIYCTGKTQTERPELCAAMVRASIRGWAYALDHEAKTLEVVMDYCTREHLPTNRN
ncbi:MAG: ABC transporter substrate-binding protein, partial [Planctomycetia bacterium]